MDTDTIISGIAALTSLVALVVSVRKKRGLSLAEIAVRSVAAAEQMCAGKPRGEKWRFALGAAQRLDAGDNGKRDFTDAQLRLAIEAELARGKE